MDVILPDGTTVTGVPEGMSKAALTAKLGSKFGNLNFLQGANASSSRASARVPQPSMVDEVNSRKAKEARDAMVPGEVGLGMAETVLSKQARLPLAMASAAWNTVGAPMLRGAGGIVGENVGGDAEAGRLSMDRYRAPDVMGLQATVGKAVAPVIEPIARPLVEEFNNASPETQHLLRQAGDWASVMPGISGVMAAGERSVAASAAKGLAQAARRVPRAAVDNSEVAKVLGLKITPTSAHNLDFPSSPLNRSMEALGFGHGPVYTSSTNKQRINQLLAEQGQFKLDHNGHITDAGLAPAFARPAAVYNEARAIPATPLLSEFRRGVAAIDIESQGAEAAAAFRTLLKKYEGHDVPSSAAMLEDIKQLRANAKSRYQSTGSNRIKDVALARLETQLRVAFEDELARRAAATGDFHLAERLAAANREFGMLATIEDHSRAGFFDANALADDVVKGAVKPTGHMAGIAKVAEQFPTDVAHPLSVPYERAGVAIASSPEGAAVRTLQLLGGKQIAEAGVNRHNRSVFPGQEATTPQQAMPGNYVPPTSKEPTYPSGPHLMPPKPTFAAPVQGGAPDLPTPPPGLHLAPDGSEIPGLPRSRAENRQADKVRSLLAAADQFSLEGNMPQPPARRVMPRELTLEGGLDMERNPVSIEGIPERTLGPKEPWSPDQPLFAGKGPKKLPKDTPRDLYELIRLLRNQ